MNHKDVEKLALTLPEGIDPKDLENEAVIRVLNAWVNDRKKMIGGVLDTNAIARKVFAPRYGKVFEDKNPVSSMRRMDALQGEITEMAADWGNPTGFVDIGLGPDEEGNEGMGDVFDTVKFTNGTITFYDFRKSSIRARQITKYLGMNVMQFWSGHFYKQARKIGRMAGADHWKPSHPAAFGGDAEHWVVPSDVVPRKKGEDKEQIVRTSSDKGVILGLKFKKLAKFASVVFSKVYKDEIQKMKLPDGVDFFDIGTAVVKNDVIFGDAFTLNTALNAKHKEYENLLGQMCKEDGLPTMTDVGISQVQRGGPVNALSPGMNLVCKVESLSKIVREKGLNVSVLTTGTTLGFMTEALQEEFDQITEEGKPELLGDGSLEHIYGLKAEHDHNSVDKIVTAHNRENKAV